MGSDGTGKGSNNRGSGKIYVVDDEPMLLELVSDILSPEGYEIIGFRNGEAALEAYLAEPQKPALLITDFAMGRDLMSGMDFVHACRAAHPRQKVLLLSGTVDENIYQNASEKPDAFLAKPYQPKELTAVVRRLTDS